MKFLTTLLLGVVFLFPSSQDTLLEQIKAKGELRVITRYGLTTYYKGPQGQEMGLEYDLAKRFADELGVKLHLIVTDSFNEILQTVAHQEVHFAAAGLTINHERKTFVRFGPNYQTITQQVIYRQGSFRPPHELAKFTNHSLLKIVPQSNQEEILQQLEKEFPHLTWETVSEVEPSELIEQVWEGDISSTLADSNEFAQLRRFYPELQIATELSQTQQLAWAFPRTSYDDSLYLATIQFFNRIRRTGELAQLIDRYYGHVEEREDFNYVNLRVFHRHIQERLPKYRKYFEIIAARHQLDWRLLAAIGYEESKWDPEAISETGVRGLMMLTKTTAREMGVGNREDPLESIEGGAKYFVGMKERIHQDVPEPDRTWFAVAAYNVGLAHLQDVMQLTLQGGGNPNRWVDIKKYLPKLSEEEWYTRTQHGYARGKEPVKMVKNVRRFYDILVRLEATPEIFPPSELPNLEPPPHLPIL